MGCVPSSQKSSQETTANCCNYNDETWLNRPQGGYHWEQNKQQNSNSKGDGRNVIGSEKDGTGVEGYVAAESYGGADGIGGVAGCGAGGCGGCGGCGA